jgi:hypothetical protein
MSDEKVAIVTGGKGLEPGMTIWLTPQSRR